MKQVLLLTIAIIIGLLLIPLIACLFKNTKIKSLYHRIIFILYGCSVLYFTLFCRTISDTIQLRFHPLLTYKQAFLCWRGDPSISQSICRAILRSSKNILHVTKNSPIEDSFLNILLFIPFGFLAGYVFKKTSFWKVLISATLISTMIELVQAISRLGCCDIDDVINNTLGTLLGWILYRCQKKFY